MNILIQNIEHQGKTVDIRIRDNRFERIDEKIQPEGNEKIIDGRYKSILPPFYNTHTHAAMCILRGFADDVPLHVWLNEHIWPMEAKFTAEDIYAGSRLAILEMIKSGCVFFNDMYWMVDETIRAVQEMGVRAHLGVTFLEAGNPEVIESRFAYLEKMRTQLPPRIQLGIMPHAIYTVSETLFKKCHRLSREYGLKFHTHLAETKKEVNDCLEKHGCTPVELLDRWGVLDKDTIVAHAVHLNDEDIKILAQRDVVISHNPCSNMKLASGHLNLARLKRAGCRITLGTDGAASNNNLDMSEEIKIAGLLAKSFSEPQEITAEYLYHIASQAGAEAFDLDAGIIREGSLADAILVNLKNERLVPSYNLISDMVYSADSRCIDTVLCDGRILMENGIVPNENEIIEQAWKSKKRLLAC